jgi:hypothetical protein
VLTEIYGFIIAGRIKAGYRNISVNHRGELTTISSLFISFVPRTDGDEKLTALIKPGRKLDKSVPAQKDHLHIQLSLNIPILTPRIERDEDLLQNTSVFQLFTPIAGQSSAETMGLREQVVTTAFPSAATYRLHLRLLHLNSFSPDITGERA